MHRYTATVLLTLVICACKTETAQEQADWKVVLARKKAISGASADQLLRTRQSYVDALRDFSRRYPSHERAREVYRQAELEFARELLTKGSYSEAIRFYESVLHDDPDNMVARKELAAAQRRRFVTRQDLEALRKGMRPEEVAERLGRPSPDWEKFLQKNRRAVMSWYYPRSDGGVGGVYFVDGRLFAADYGRAVPLKP